MKKLGKKKTIIAIVIAVIVLLVAVVGIIFALPGFTISDSEREEALVTAGTAFYEKHMSGISGVDEQVITLDEIKRVMNEYENEKYDLEKLEDCDGKTKVTFTIENQKIVGNRVELSCK